MSSLECFSVDEERLTQLLEEVCQLGCQTVDEVIDMLSKGKVPVLLNSLNEAEIERMQFELIAVMKPLKRD